ncbi:hypothetical protein [Corynebacterium anserum]|uniref:Uncharacterized protein n=1 Tax=Corynebacterium anserum TaxID=2684406 RepID=A0A7G7YMB0_9CORY|nr:hypothetical protein [Corynebacterium anserum]MBC2680987.1 hypothetical protein [Corynebacterium anserum]QNH95630.1 hypothetical protein GP473_02075 [Corynebacterium anserum]
MWTLSHAVNTIGGTVSAWGFGGESIEVIRPATPPRQVPLVTDNGSQSSHGPVALARAAAAARFLESTEARVMLVLTNGQLPERDLEVMDQRFKRLYADRVRCMLVNRGVYGSIVTLKTRQ